MKDYVKHIVGFDNIDSLYVDIYNEKKEDLKALDESFYKDRKEAENEAFSKAFELLENKLINEK